MKTPPYGTGGPLPAPNKPDVNVELLALLKQQMETNREMQTAVLNLLRKFPARRPALPAPRRCSQHDDELFLDFGEDFDFDEDEEIIPVSSSCSPSMPMPPPCNPNASTSRRPGVIAMLVIGALVTFAIALQLTGSSIIGTVLVTLIGCVLVVLAAIAAW